LISDRIPPLANNELPENNTTRSLESAEAHDQGMFVDILLSSSIGQRNRRTWATVSSFILQLLVIGFLFLLPLWFTEALPMQQLLTFLEAPPPPAPPPPPPPSHPSIKTAKSTSDIANGRLRTPSRIPAKVEMIQEDDAAPPVAISGGIVGGVPGGIAGGQLGGVIGGIIGSSSSVSAVPTLPKPATQRVRVSQGVINGLLVNRVEPTYPPLAQQARIRGVVVLTAIIGKDGSVQHLQVASGHPLLASAAVAAVKQWRYKPYILNGEPVEVETTITVTFHVQSS
jgi:protein TonB